SLHLVFMKSFICRVHVPLTRTLILTRNQAVFRYCWHNYRIDPLLYHGVPQREKYWDNLNYRNFSISCPLYDLKDSSKVEQTVKARREEAKEKAKAIVEAPPKRNLVKRIWDELVHYYHGFRLLFIDVGIASRLIWKVLNGEDLSRREHKQ